MKIQPATDSTSKMTKMICFIQKLEKKVFVKSQSKFVLTYLIFVVMNYLTKTVNYYITYSKYVSQNSIIVIKLAWVSGGP